MPWRATLPDGSDHVMASFQQARHDGTADEPVRAGHEDARDITLAWVALGA